MLSEIENSKNNSLERLLFGLGIRYVGKKTAKILAINYMSMDNFLKATFDDLVVINDIGDVIAKSVYEYINNENNIKLINELQSLGLNMQYLGKVEYKEEFTNKTFVITGTLSMPRDVLRSKIEELGGKVSESVSKKTDYVIVGENPGSKYEKAQKLALNILDEKAIIDMIES